MYPAHLFALFPPFPRENRVFVAMSFDHRFDQRWRNVIDPGIRATGLESFRVDARRVGDSILTEILTGVSNSQLVFVDLSTLDDHRNGNVMYELGLAHAVRQPQEVLLFRSDDDSLVFDITQVRVNSYNPDGEPDAARQQVTEAITEAIREIDLTKNLSVQRIVSSLNYWEIETLLSLTQQSQLHYPAIRTMRDVMSHMYRIPAITRLLESGLIETACPEFGPEVAALPEDTQMSGFFAFRLTPFGQAVAEKIGRTMVGRLSEGDINQLAQGQTRGASNAQS